MMGKLPSGDSGLAAYAQKIMKIPKAIDASAIEQKTA
jgi:hypothetical protein